MSQRWITSLHFVFWYMCDNQYYTNLIKISFSFTNTFHLICASDVSAKKTKPKIKKKLSSAQRASDHYIWSTIEISAKILNTSFNHKYCCKKKKYIAGSWNMLNQKEWHALTSSHDDWTIHTTHQCWFWLRRYMVNPISDTPLVLTPSFTNPLQSSLITTCI